MKGLLACFLLHENGTPFDTSSATILPLSKTDKWLLLRAKLPNNRHNATTFVVNKTTTTLSEIADPFPGSAPSTGASHVLRHTSHLLLKCHRRLTAIASSWSLP